MTDTILIVDDEDGVRRTFQDWLTVGVPTAQVFAAADAEAALRLANDHPIDLAILDWNLGTGSDGLRLLEDLAIFRPDIVAILITGFAGQATPLDALRMGVRDYLDKNQDLTRDNFVRAVTRQLDRVRPAKRQRELNAGLAAFREAVGKILPLVRNAAALNDPVPLPDAIHSLLRFLMRATGAIDAALVIRLTAEGQETTTAYGIDGQMLDVGAVPFARSLAAAVVGNADPILLAGGDPATAGMIEWHPFERNRSAILAAPLRVGPGAHVVAELFDNPSFSEADKKLVAAAVEVGAELIRQALAERQTHRLLFDAVQAALSTSEDVARSIDGPPSVAVMDELRKGLAADPNAVVEAEAGLRLIQAVRTLAVRHGSPAVEHCTDLVERLGKLLDGVTG